MALAGEGPVIERQTCLTRLAEVVASASAVDVSCGLMLVGLSNLGELNRRFGYAHGDQLICSVNDQLRGIATLPDTVFRVGGHVFAFILPRLQNPGFIALAVNRVERVLREVLDSESGAGSVAVHVGVGFLSAGGGSADDLLMQAEQNLALVRRGKAPGIDELLSGASETLNDHELEAHFIAALQDNAFELHYQPKVQLQSGRVCGAEALLRWRLPGIGPVAPDKVVRLAEEQGKLFELTKWVVHHALRELRSWGGQYPGGLSVNIPASLVGLPDLVNMVHDALSIWGIDARRLTLEITEDAIIEDKEAGFDVLQELCELGCRVSIDDFGTGYSSLSYFQHIPARELKIDKSFIARIVDHPREQSLVKVMHDIARLFELEVVAEGVEDQATLDILSALGCDLIQGYYYTPALEAGAFLEWVCRRES